MMKKLIAVISALAMLLSLAACGNYEITIVEKDKETKAVSDSIDENEDEPEEDEEESEEETEEETEKKTEKESEDEPEEDDGENSKYLSSFKEVKKYLSKFVDLDGYSDQPDSDSDDLYYYSMSYEEDEKTKVNFNLKISGKELDFPARYGDIKKNGFTFASSMHNEKSEQTASTTSMGWYMNAPGGGTVDIYSVNPEDYDKPVTDLDFYGIRLYGYYFDNKEIVKDNRFSKVKINDSITLNSTVEDVIDEFGTPNNVYIILSEYRTEIKFEYREGTGSLTESLDFTFCYEDDETSVKEIYYAYPEREIYS